MVCQYQTHSDLNLVYRTYICFEDFEMETFAKKQFKDFNALAYCS